MLDKLKVWKGSIVINGKSYDAWDDAQKRATSDEKITDVILYAKANRAVESSPDALATVQSVEYMITVKKYMTKPSSPSFDFMEKWNNNIPMPLMRMMGTVEKETRGMVYMKLRGDFIGDTSSVCLRCGKEINNPVSKYFGMGPICGSHNYVNPFDTEEELRQAIDRYRREYLQKITWEGWIIKSAITSRVEVR